MPLATISPKTSGTNNGYTLSTSSERGYARGESVIFSKKVLVPLGITLASAIGIYLLYKYRQGKKEVDDAEDLFRPSEASRAADAAAARAVAASSLSATNLNNRNASARQAAIAGDDNAMRRKALDDLMQIINGIPEGAEGRAARDGADNEHPFMRANRIMNEKRQKKERSAVVELADDAEEEDEDAYIYRFFEYEPIPEGYAAARLYCLAAVEAALAVLEGRKPKKSKKKDEDDDFEDEESNPDPILQVATQIEVDLRHRLAYFAQEFGIKYFKENEEASDVCATYAGTIPPIANMPKGGLTKKVMLEAVKEYIEVCSEIERTKPIVVELAKEDAHSDVRDKKAWKGMSDRYRDVSEAPERFTGGGGKAAKKGKSKFADTYSDDDDDDENKADAGQKRGDFDDVPASQRRRNGKEAALGRMLAAREDRFMAGHAGEKMDQLLQEKQRRLMRFGDAMGGVGKGKAAKDEDDEDDEDDDDDAEFEDDDLDEDMAFIASPLHDVNRRAFEAALIRSVLKQVASDDDPIVKKHLEVLDTVAAQFREPSLDEDDEEGEEEDYDDYDDWGYGMGGEDEDYEDDGMMMFPPGFGGMGGGGFGDEVDFDGEDDGMNVDGGFYGPMGMGGGMGRMLNQMASRRRRGGGPMMGDDEDDEYAQMFGNDDDEDYDDAEEDAMLEQMMRLQAARMRGAMLSRGRRGAGRSRGGRGAKAMFVDDDDDGDEDGIPHLDGNDERDAFIREMIQREAVEYNAMRKAQEGKRKGAGGSSKVEEIDHEDDEWVDY